jgi:hypothetical protein
MEVLDTEDLIDDFQFGIHTLLLFEELFEGVICQYPTIVATFELAQSKRGDSRLCTSLREIYLNNASLARSIRSCVTYMKAFAEENKTSCSEEQAVLDLMGQVARFNEDNLRRRDEMDNFLSGTEPPKELRSLYDIRVNHGLDLRLMVEEVLQASIDGGGRPTLEMIRSVIDRHFKRAFKELYPMFDVCAVAREAKSYCYIRKVSHAIIPPYS